MALLNAAVMTRGQVGLGGFILLAIGVVLLGLSLWLATSTIERRSTALNVAETDARQCADRLQGLGFVSEVSAEGGAVIARRPAKDDPRIELGVASAASLICPGWVMSGFCFGSACSYAAGVELVLASMR